MEGKFFILIVAAVTLSLAHGKEEPPPMYSAHDFASGQLQQRRKIEVEKPCDAEFGTKLEAIVTEMEDNKEGTEELATRLKNQFTELMDQNKDKNLCAKTLWCDKDVCKQRVVPQGRSAPGQAPAKPAPEQNPAAPPAQPRAAPHHVEREEEVSSSTEAHANGTSALAPSSALWLVVFTFVSLLMRL